MLRKIISEVSRLSKRSLVHQKAMPLLHNVDIPTKKATFAMGCFWAPDSLFGATKGVIRTRVGFTGGSKINPAYRSLGDHTEAIEIDFDNESISYENLLAIFWTNHDPTAKMSKQYTSIIFYHDEEQKVLAEKTLKEQQAKKSKSLVTTIERAQTFYDAETYHQKYRLQGYPDLMEAIQLHPTTEALTKSHLAARLNGYVVGCGGVQQFENEVSKLGLDENTADTVRKLVTKYEGHGMFC